MSLPPGARRVDPEAEAARLAAERAQPAPKAVACGDLIKVATDGGVFTGWVVAVEAAEGGFVVRAELAGA